MSPQSFPRTNLTLPPDVEGRPTAADAVTAGPQGVEAALAAGVELHVRIANPRAGRLREELDEAASPSVAVVLLAETALPQDLRDADVELRRQELRHDLRPGRIRLIAEVGSAGALARLGDLLRAVDRLHSVSIDIEGIARSLGAASATARELQEPLLAQVAVTATAAGVPWTVGGMGLSSGDRAALASRARALGAAGVYVLSEAEVAGFNSLFTRE